MVVWYFDSYVNIAFVLLILPYNSLDLCVDKYTEAAHKFRNTSPDKLRWGQRIEYPGVMDLIGVEGVQEKLDGFMRA
jgi:heptosyltransferase I